MAFPARSRVDTIASPRMGEQGTDHMEWMLLPLKRYAQFSGRSRRKEFWMWLLFVVIVSIVLSVLDSLLGLGGSSQVASSPINPHGFAYGARTRGGILTGIFTLAILIPNLAVSVRRLHDVDRSGWWVLLPVAPYAIGVVLIFSGAFTLGALLAIAGLVCAIVLLVWYCTRGTIGPNRFGADPLGLDPAAVGRVFE